MNYGAPSLGYIFPMPIGCNQWSSLFPLASEMPYAVTKICVGMVDRLGHRQLTRLAAGTAGSWSIIDWFEDDDMLSWRGFPEKEKSL